MFKMYKIFASFLIIFISFVESEAIFVLKTNNISVNGSQHYSTILGYCSHDNDCMGTYSRCIDSFCRCLPNYIRKSDLTDCTYTSCTRDYDCREYDNNRNCSYGSCICKPGYYEDNSNGRKCKLTGVSGYINGGCTRDSNCMGVNTRCVDSICRCVPNYKPNSDMKECSLFSCTTSSDCKTYDSNRYCNTMGTCVCNTGFSEDSSNGRKCKLTDSSGFTYSIHINSSCIRDTDCLGSKTRCVDSICKCMANYKPNSNLNDCNYFSCSYDSDCKTYDSNRRCNSGSCVCNTGYSEDSTNGRKCKLTGVSGYINGSCFRDSDCLGSKTRCVDSICKCISNYKPNTNFNDCNFFSCAYDSDCKTYDPNRGCNSGSCVCNTGYSEDNTNGRKCKYSSGHINGFCTSDSSCLGGNTRCVDSICRCRPNYTPNSNLDDCNYFTCSNDTICKTYDTNRYCSSGSCVCNTGYSEDYNNGRKCKYTSGGSGYVSDFCTTHTDCKGINTRCVDNKCRCLPNYKSNSNRDECNYFSCTSDTSCWEYDYNRECSYGSCDCSSGYEEDYTNGHKCIYAHSYSSAYIAIGFTLPAIVIIIVILTAIVRRRQRLNLVNVSNPVSNPISCPVSDHVVYVKPPPYSRY